MIRGIVLSIKAMPYIEAVKAMGAGPLKTYLDMFLQT